jgi:dipeptide transport system ATP-binding protein
MSAPSNTPSPADQPVVVATNLRRVYPISKGLFRKPDLLQAVSGVSFTVHAGKTLAVVGESGCGKSTLARMVTLIESPSEGSLKLGGVDVITATPQQRHALRQTVQLVFQNPYGSLNPRKRIGQILEAPLEINTKLNATERAEKARAMLALVGLRPEHYDRYPHMFSGGQRQRIAIARALMLNPSLVVADEPVSALDVSIQAQVLNLLADLQRDLGLAYLFISHDLVWSATLPTTCWLCTWVTPWSKATKTPSLTALCTPTPRPCWAPRRDWPVVARPATALCSQANYPPR